MTTVELELTYQAQPSEPVIAALAHARQVYGIRALLFNHDARTLRVEFDATRLNATTVIQLLRSSGLDLVEPPDAPPQQAPAA